MTGITNSLSYQNSRRFLLALSASLAVGAGAANADTVAPNHHGGFCLDLIDGAPELPQQGQAGDSSSILTQPGQAHSKASGLGMNTLDAPVAAPQGGSSGARGGFSTGMNISGHAMGGQPMGMGGAVSTDDEGLRIVPLPAAAYAGLGMLLGIAGFRSVRSRD